ncbi:MAG TPA: PqqD family protein, partial [Planctomycetota bacterium]|nr:PqqD family protein [Planctomycetota bacterium]
MGDRGAAEARPRWRDGVVLRNVPSRREGTRYVLQDTQQGRYFELPGGEKDAFVWERLDGKNTLHDIALAFLDEHGALPRDLAGLVQRLGDEGLLQGAGKAKARPRRSSLERVLAPRIPVVGLGAVLSGIGGAFSVFWRLPVVLLLLMVGAAGLGLLAWEPQLLDRVRGSFVIFRGEPMDGVVLLLGLSFAFSVLETLARAAALRRGKGAIREAGLAFPLLVPGLYVEDALVLLLPVELRVLVHLAPLAVSAGLAGAASLGLHFLPLQGVSDPRLLELLGKVAVLGFLRALFHANPIGPSGLARALATWFHVEDLAAASRRFFAHELFHHHDHGLAPRERFLLAHGVASLAWLALAARALGRLAMLELAPRFEAALHESSSRDLAALLVPLAIAAVPLVFVTAGLLVALGRALARALSRSHALGSPHGAATLVAAFGLLLAVQASQVAGAAHAAALGLFAALLAFRAPREDGRGRAARALTVLAIAFALETFAQLLVADAALERRALGERALLALAWAHVGASLLVLAAASLELATSSRLGILVAPMGALALLAAAGSLALPFVPQAPKRLPPEFVLPAIGLGATLLYLASFVASLGSPRATSRGWLALSALVLGAARSGPLLSQLKVELPAGLTFAALDPAGVTLAFGLAAAALVARA